MKDFETHDFDVPRISLFSKLRFFCNDMYHENTKAYMWHNRIAAVCAVGFLALVTAGVVDELTNDRKPTYEERVDDQYARFSHCMPQDMISLDVKIAYPEYRLDDSVESKLAECRAKYPLPAPDAAR